MDGSRRLSLHPETGLSSIYAAALAPYSALTDATAQSSAFLLIPGQCFPDELQAFSGAFTMC